MVVEDIVSLVVLLLEVILGGDYSRNHQGRSAPAQVEQWMVQILLRTEGKHGMVVVWEFK